MKTTLSLSLKVVLFFLFTTPCTVNALNLSTLPPDTLSLDELFVLLEQQQLAKTAVVNTASVVETQTETTAEVKYVSTEIRFLERATRFWSAELAMQYVDFIAKEMHAKPSLKLVLIGHTDIAESDAKAVSLALQRAELVKATIMRRGITEDRIIIKDLGNTKPKVAKGSGFNRRVELVLVR